MRRTLAVLLAAAAVAGTFGVAATSNEAEAQTRRARSDVVVITPRWLSAGTIYSEGETLGAVPNADARFISTGRNIPGTTYNDLRTTDPWYLPRPHFTFVFDSPLGSKGPGER